MRAGFKSRRSVNTLLRVKLFLSDAADIEASEPKSFSTKAVCNFSRWQAVRVAAARPPSTKMAYSRARFLPIYPCMGRVNTSADMLIEILDLFEQTLTAVCIGDDASSQRRPSDKSSQSRQQMRANVARRLTLIQGGLAGNLRHPNAR